MHYFNEKESLHHDVAIKALDDGCEYVRYLAAKGLVLFDKSSKDQEIIKKIENDKSELVKYAQEERDWSFSFPEPEEFFKFPKNKQLAILRREHGLYGSTFAELVEWAIDQKNIDENHLVELTLEYFKVIRAKRNHVIGGEAHGYWKKNGFWVRGQLCTGQKVCALRVLQGKSDTAWLCEVSAR